MRSRPGWGAPEQGVLHVRRAQHLLAPYRQDVPRSSRAPPILPGPALRRGTAAGADHCCLSREAGVANVATEEWQGDPEIGGGVEEHVLFDTGTMRAGLSRFTKDADQQPPTWVLPATQVLLVLEGEARVEMKDGPVLELKAGDMACLPKGAATTWHLTLPFKEMWVLAE